MHGPSLSCNSSGKTIAILRDCRAHQLARWCQFVSIERLEPLQTALQGTFARAMISRKITEDQRPATHGPQNPVSAQLVHRPSLSCNSSGKAIAILRDCRAYLLARWHRFVSIERREPRQTALQGTFARAMVCRKITEDQRPATHGLRARLVLGPSLSCNSPGTRIGLPGPSRAYQLARWHRFVSIERLEPLQTALQGTFARAMIF